ncbi:hypothetical protein E2C01_074906 [Portunus trituberculatus]|uniref:Uncharacterized protein n=1 Tax=Portunus trituberculatus TaxID=210409 RepID=A0A5B7IHH8_PORTR|nr:hypothetical protein [Portunus trituberculatus]
MFVFPPPLKKKKKKEKEKQSVITISNTSSLPLLPRPLITTSVPPACNIHAAAALNSSVATQRASPR